MSDNIIVGAKKTAVVVGAQRTVLVFPRSLPGEPGQGVPTGGATGQVLAKVDGTDYNTEWVDQSGGGLENPVDHIDFAASPTEAIQPRRLQWNADAGTLDLGMDAAGVVQQIGEELFFRVKNQTGSTIANGTLVMSSGTTGNSGRILVAPSINDGSFPSHLLVGVVTHSLTDGADGFATHFGQVRGIDTTGAGVSETWADGDLLYPNPAQPGKLTNIPPTGSGLKNPIAIVIHAHSNGSIFVRMSASGAASNSFRDSSGNAVDGVTTAIYRTDPVTIGATSGEGVLNVKSVPDDNTKALCIAYDDASGGAVLISFIPENQQDNPGVNRFTFNASNVPGANEPFSDRANHVFIMGYNVGPGGGRVSSNDASLHISFESCYYLQAASQGLPVGSLVWEWHLQASNTVNNTAHRVITAIGAQDGSAGNIGFTADGFHFAKYNEPATLWIAANRFDKAFTIYDEMPIYFNKNGNGKGGFLQRNAADTTYLNLAYADEFDRLVLGGAGVASSYLPHGVLLLGSNAEILGESNVVKIGRTTSPQRLDLYANGTEVIRLQSSSGGADVWKIEVASDNLSIKNPQGTNIIEAYEGTIPTLYIANNRWGFAMSPGARWSLKQSSNAAGGGFQIQNLSGSHDFYFNLDANGAFRFFNTTAGERFAILQDGTLSFGATKRQVFSATATPESAITASPGDITLTNESGTGKVYVKRTGTGNTGHSELQQKADAYVPLQKTDAAAVNGELYYSTTQGKLCYKDPGGTVNPLY